MKHANASFTVTGHCEERQKIIKVKFDHFYFRLPLKNDFETIYKISIVTREERKEEFQWDGTDTAQGGGHFSPK